MSVRSWSSSVASSTVTSMSRTRPRTTRSSSRPSSSEASLRRLPRCMCASSSPSRLVSSPRNSSAARICSCDWLTVLAISAVSSSTTPSQASAGASSASRPRNASISPAMTSGQSVWLSMARRRWFAVSAGVGGAFSGRLPASSSSASSSMPAPWLPAAASFQISRARRSRAAGSCSRPSSRCTSSTGRASPPCSTASARRVSSVSMAARSPPLRAASRSCASR